VTDYQPKMAQPSQLGYQPFGLKYPNVMKRLYGLLEFHIVLVINEGSKTVVNCVKGELYLTNLVLGGTKP